MAHTSHIAARAAAEIRHRTKRERRQLPFHFVVFSASYRLARVRSLTDMSFSLGFAIRASRRVKRGEGVDP
jgi:hypothetical protein